MAESRPKEEPCRMEIHIDSHGAKFAFLGRMDAGGVGPIWQRAVDSISSLGACEVDLSKVDYIDGAGVALLLDLRRRAGGDVVLQGLTPKYEQLLAPFEKTEIPKNLKDPVVSEPSLQFIGRMTLLVLTDLREQITFVGRLLVLFTQVARHPGMVRWKEVFLTFEKVGNEALLIVGLIGFLMGMILAFQSVVPLQQFGVDIFVVNLVALAMFRELGVIMTAIMLAGRSGSAFAAEIGTMKVNEEINALNTMGLDPARFLVVPRVLAGVLAMPVLTMYANVIGIFGGLLVATTFGHSWSAVWTQLLGAVDVSDVATGMMKSVVFGFLVATIGCLRGLQTQLGALAVGESTTRAVVSSIVLIVFTDGIFAIVFYAIGF